MSVQLPARDADALAGHTPLAVARFAYGPEQISIVVSYWSSSSSSTAAHAALGTGQVRAFTTAQIEALEAADPGKTREEHGSHATGGDLAHQLVAVDPLPARLRGGPLGQALGERVVKQGCTELAIGAIRKVGK